MLICQCPLTVKSRSDAEGHRGAPETGHERKILMTNRLWDFMQSLFSLNAVKHLDFVFILYDWCCLRTDVNYESIRGENFFFFPFQHLFQ